MVPPDLTPVEVIAFVGYITAGGLAKNLAESVKPRLEVARTIPIIGRQS